MTFEDFLVEHQKLVMKLLEGKPNLERMKNLEKNLNVTIEAYCACADSYSFAAKKWNAQVKQLCELRNLLLTGIEKLGDPHDQPKE